MIISFALYSEKKRKRTEREREREVWTSSTKVREASSTFSKAENAGTRMLGCCGGEATGWPPKLPNFRVNLSPRPLRGRSLFNEASRGNELRNAATPKRSWPFREFARTSRCRSDDLPSLRFHELLLATACSWFSQRGNIDSAFRFAATKSAINERGIGVSIVIRQLKSN